MRIIDTLDMTTPGWVLGNHACWNPSLGIKLPWQWSGRLQKRTRPDEPSYPLDSIVDEIQILRALAERQMAPPVGDLVFVRNVISDFPGAWWCDPTGAVAYEIADARKLPPGRFFVEAMRRLPIEGSEGAWNDISVRERENVVNGYIVDVRRSAFDMLRWRGERFELPDGREDVDELRARVHRECQFPAGEREQAYQDFWIGERSSVPGYNALDEERGQRRVYERCTALGFAPVAGESVLDIGCQSGGFLQTAWLGSRHGARCVGIDVSPEYIDCARALARSMGANINYRCIGATDPAFLPWVRALFPSGVDHLLCLSMEKHLPIWPLVDAIGAKRTYIETNAVKSVDDMKLWPEVAKRGGVHLGQSSDRNLRQLYRIDRG